MKKLFKTNGYLVCLKENITGHNIILIFNDYELLGYFWLNEDKEPYSLSIINATEHEIEYIIYIKNNTNWSEIA